MGIGIVIFHFTTYAANTLSTRSDSVALVSNCGRFLAFWQISFTMLRMGSPIR